MSSNYRGKNFDPNYHLRNKGNNNGFHHHNNINNNNNQFIHYVHNNSGSSSNNNNFYYDPQGPKRKRLNKGPTPGQGNARGKNKAGPSNNLNQNNNYHTDNSNSNQRVVVSPSSSFAEQSDVESDPESEASGQSSDLGHHRLSQAQRKMNGPGVNGSNYLGPPEKYNPNYHKNKWKRARSSSGDTHEGGAGGGSFSGVVGATYCNNQSNIYQPTSSATVSPAMGSVAELGPHETIGQESPIMKLFGLVIPPVPRSTPQLQGNRSADPAVSEIIKADTKDQLRVEILQLELERAFAVKENREGDAQRVDFEIFWRKIEDNYYQMAFRRADTIKGPAEKVKYLLELQVAQNEARRRMKDHIKRVKPSALHALMNASSTSMNETHVQVATGDASTSTLPAHVFWPAQGHLKSIEDQEKQNIVYLDPVKTTPAKAEPELLLKPESNPIASPHSQAGPAGSHVQVKTEPPEPMVGNGATIKASSIPSPALVSTAAPVAPSTQASIVPTVVADTTMKSSPPSASTAASSFSTGISAAPAISCSTFTPIIVSSPFSFSSADSSPFSFGQTTSPALSTSTSTLINAAPSEPKVTSIPVKDRNSSTTVSATHTVTTRLKASLPPIVPSPPHLHTSKIATQLPGLSSEAESESTQGATHPSATTTLPIHTQPVVHSTASPVPTVSASASASVSALPQASLPSLPSSTPAAETLPQHSNAEAETCSMLLSLPSSSSSLSSSPSVTQDYSRRTLAVDNLASLVLASASSLIPADLDKQMAKLQEDNREQGLKYETLQRMVESEARRREVIEKQVSEYQVNLQSARITALEKDLECRRSEAVEMMAKAREERLQAREETAKARQSQAEAREEVTKARLGQAEATLRATTAEAENQRLWNWFKINESRLAGIPLPPSPFSGTAPPSLTMTPEGPSSMATSPVVASVDQDQLPAPPNAQPLATADRLALSEKRSGSASESDMDLGSESGTPVEARPLADLAVPV